MDEIVVKFPGGKRVDAEYKGLTVKTDQPVYHGGEGAFPSPFDLFLVSIATCAGHYVLSFCESRGIPSEGVSVVQKLKKDLETKRIVVITIEVILPPGFPEKYVKAVLKAMDSCAVKAHLIDPPEFEIKAVQKHAD